MDFGYQKIFNEVIASALKESKLDKDKLNSFQEKIPEVISDVSQSSAKLILESVEEALYETLYINRLIRDEFLLHQDQKWRVALAYFEALYHISIECGAEHSEYINRINKNKEESYLCYTLKYIHARMCHIMSEILCLIRHGFADGAYARWRTLDELKITMYFIKKYGEKVAKSYYEYMDFEDYKTSKRDAESKGKELNLISQENQDKFRIYEGNSSTNYEWARCAECFSNNKRRITFRELKIKTDFDTEFKEQYDMSNKIIHASPSATFFRISSPEGAKAQAIVGATDFGINIPGDNAALSMIQGTICYITTEPTIDSIISANVLLMFFEKTREAFAKSEKELFTYDD